MVVYFKALFCVFYFKLLISWHTSSIRASWSASWTWLRGRFPPPGVAWATSPQTVGLSTGMADTVLVHFCGLAEVVSFGLLGQRMHRQLAMSCFGTCAWKGTPHSACSFGKNYVLARSMAQYWCSGYIIAKDCFVFARAETGLLLGHG